MEKVSLYIPAFNAARSIERCIEGLLRQKHAADEILLIDDGSRDDTARLAARFPVRVVSHGSNRGLGAARNTGLREARNGLVGCVDADVVAEPAWLARLVAVMKDPAVAIAGGKLDEAMRESIPDRWRREHMSQHWGDAERRNPPSISGSNQLLRREIVQRAGGYDESFRSHGGDADMCRKVRALGFDTLYTPEAAAHHLRTDTVRSVLDGRWREWVHAEKPYERGATLAKIARNAVNVHVRAVAVPFLRKDLSTRSLGCAAMDALLPLYMTARDVELYVRTRGRP